jgi:hypothetical protein
MSDQQPPRSGSDGPSGPGDPGDQPGGQHPGPHFEPAPPDGPEQTAPLEPAEQAPPYGAHYAAGPPPAPGAAEQPPPHQYGTGYPVGESTSGRKAGLILAVAGGIVVVAAAVILGFVYFGSTGGTGSPEDAVKRFTSAVSDGDCEKATDVLSAKLKASAPCELFADTPLGNISVSFDNIAVTSQTADKATVTAGLSGFGHTFALTFLVVHEGDKWLIDDISAADGPR